VTVWVFDEIAGQFVVSHLLPSAVCGAGGLCRVSCFDSKGSQWMAAASGVGNSRFNSDSELVIYRNLASDCAEKNSCNTSWNVVQRVPALGGILRVQVISPLKACPSAPNIPHHQCPSFAFSPSFPHAEMVHKHYTQFHPHPYNSCSCKPKCPRLHVPRLQDCQ
jgi:hypothetical protein